MRHGTFIRRHSTSPPKLPAMQLRSTREIAKIPDVEAKKLPVSKGGRKPKQGRRNSSETESFRFLDLIPGEIK
jgi:hypothetical protein